MQEKLQKLFSFFKKIKNEPFYTSIIAQIIQTYQTCPESLKYILYNLNQLIFTSTQQVKLRIKHRLICASIIAKLSLIYVNRIKRCIENNEKIDLENFQLETEDIETQNQLFSKMNSDEIWQKMDLFKVIQTQQPLMSTKRQGTGDQQEDDKNENKIFQQYLNMNQATMINIEQIFKDVKSDKANVQVAFEKNKEKYKIKLQKICKKKQQYSQTIKLKICNPFNLLYQICIDNLLNPEWQLRHLSALILKQLMFYPEFIGFIGKIQIHDKNVQRDQRFQIIQAQTKEQLSVFIKNNAIKNIIYNRVIILNLKLLCRDKFADYQSDQSNIIVRAKAAETLARCYLVLQPNQQIQMLKKIKKIFDKEIKHDTNIRSNFTWEVKHSFMVFINHISQYPQQQLNVYKILQESMIKMLITQQQIDQIVYSICKCFKKFLGQTFFTQKQIQRINQQIWKIVKGLDDISISTVSALQLLSAMFPYFNLNICNSLQEIRKFVISKIPEVRKQCYCLMKMLYEKKFSTTNDKQKKLVESNIILFLQACVVEYDKQIFEVLKSFSPSIFYQVRKQRKIFQVVQFITDVVLAEENTDKLIQTKFKNFQSFGLDKNDYLYIFEFEKSYISVDKYVDKRIWKVAEVVALGFLNNYENFPDLVNAIQIHSKNSFRGKLFILHLLVRLVSVHKQEQYFTNFVKTASQLMKLDFTSVSDALILQYKTYSQKTLLQLKQNEQGIKKRLQKIPTQMKNPKQIAALHSFLCEQLLKDNNEKIKQLLQTEINIIENLIQHQRTLFKQIKVLSTCFFVKKEGITSEAINSVVTSIREALEEDRYKFLSQYGAETFIELSNHLKSRKVVLSKIVGSILTHISTKYEKKQLRINESENGYNLRADFMMGINTYIQKIIIHIPEWLQMFKQYFLVDFKTTEPKDPSLFLISGTIQSIIKICDKIFLQKLLEKLQMLGQLQEEENYKNYFNLLTKCFLEFCANYNEKSDIFYDWFIRMLQKGSIIFLETLMKIGQENIFKISSICCLFVLEIVKLLSQEKYKDMAMICLSNIVVGVYMNNRSIIFGQKLQSIAEQGIQFVKNFRDASNFEYKNVVKLKKDIQLRNYQQQGIQWLGFLTKFNLNGALCDDMGLGKTLQIFVLVQNQYIKDITQSKQLLPTLIISPTTLTQHWAYEYNKYFEKCVCHTRIISPKTTELLYKKQSSPTIYIVSYQVLEKKIDLFSNVMFKFIILDEGHVIKNPKTNKFLAVKKLEGQHRFILTGTPIQNRLKQLWSLFDFLMPGYLYSKELFKSHYEKLFQVNLTTFKQDQLLFTDEQKRILQKLHLKVMPFIMRRMKTQVLKQLPQKIINDYYCQMTNVQAELYSQFQNDNHRITKGKDQSNILSSLSKMRKILNHPNLIGKQGGYDTSGKFIALNQLFQQLGFREDQSVIQNKVIVFSRSTSTIQLIQKLFMKVLFPKLKYTKLTATVKPNQRFMVAQNFNGDNDIKVLLVTTAVGGEGLNLTSANTIIMFDHDYNPTVDMQAIDRAHRIGQRRVLSVYRLITRHTLEQRIMGIQKFKKNLAQAIVNIDNSSIKNIEDSRLPQLLQNMKDLQEKDKKQKIKKSFYNKLVEEMENDAIAYDQYDRNY